MLVRRPTSAVPGTGIEPFIPENKKVAQYLNDFLCPRRESNPYSRCGEQDFKSCVSTSSTTSANKFDLILEKKSTDEVLDIFERKTSLELATLTLARLRSTN